jgi:hypothetical protein
VTARYTRPCKPLQLEYQFEGVHAEFTVMTRGQADDDVPMSSRATIPRQTPAPIPVSANRPRTQPSVAPTQMPPPPPRSRSIRPLNGSSTQENLSQKAHTDRPLASGLSMDFDSLFVPADDDRQWDEMNEEEEPQDILGWDASGTQVCGCRSVEAALANTNCRMRSVHLSAMQSLPSRPLPGKKSQTMKWVFRPLSVCLRYVTFSRPLIDTDSCRFANMVFSTEHVFHLMRRTAHC